MGEGKTQVGALSIVGMGGSGKTTLARELYNHPYAKQCFDCCAWVCVSQDWSTQHVLSEILRKVSGPEETTKLRASSSVEELVDKLRSILEKKSYLVVLDDVWRREALEEIIPALPQGSMNKRSKIIITTRNCEIIQFQNHQEGLYVHEPRPLNEEESWTLFSKVALNHRTNNEESFMVLGKEMLKKCDGLPLAIVALAGVLNTRVTIGGWQQVGEAVRSRIEEGTGTNMYGRVGELLALSYYDLPNDLKPCFLYLAVFPEDCQIPVGMLTRMWIAEGLISAHREMSPEDVALQRLEELSHRFMVQVVRTNFKGVIKAVRLHDLLRDLCVHKAKEENFLQVYTHWHDPIFSLLSALTVQPRRAALHSSFNFPTQASHLRSLLLLEQPSSTQTPFTDSTTLDVGIVHQNFKLLRLLKLRSIKTVSGTLPTQMGSLIHLRYLEIRHTNIIELPASIGCLRNLLTLDYREVELGKDVQIKIPPVLQKLVLLRHLFLPIECPWSVVNLNLSTMVNLRILWGVKAHKGSHWLLRALPNLSPTLKKLKIVASQENDLEAAFRCPSLLSDALQAFHCVLDGSIAIRDVEPLFSRKHLHKLVLIGEIQMPLLFLLPINVITLELKDSMLNDADPMQALGALSHLKHLKLSNFCIGTSLSCNTGSFPQLEELYLENLSNLKDWRVEKGSMPRLLKLQIERCRQLHNFSGVFEFFKTLQQLEFFDVSPVFRSKAVEYGWSQKRLGLPHNFEAITKYLDIPVDIFSIRKLYEKLSAGVFLDNRKKKYWVEKQLDSFRNCFMVYASDLQMRERGVEQVKYTLRNLEDSPSVECSQVIECIEDGICVTVAKIDLPAYSYEVVGKFNTENLSTEVTYEIIWVVKLLGNAECSRPAPVPCGPFVDELEMPGIVWCRSILPNGQTKRNYQKLEYKPEEEWQQVFRYEGWRH